MCSLSLRLVITVAMLAMSACEREERRISEPSVASAPVDNIRLSPIQPGPLTPVPVTDAPYAENAYALNEGKRLYSAYNCEGCHFLGGGGMGPALMDDTWIYGSDAANIFATIVQGRPNGMPAFGSKIPRYQIWQLASYVRSMSGLVPMDVAPSRGDTMHAREPEAMKTPGPPKP